MFNSKNHSNHVINCKFRWSPPVRGSSRFAGPRTSSSRCWIASPSPSQHILPFSPVCGTNTCVEVNVWRWEKSIEKRGQKQNWKLISMFKIPVSNCRKSDFIWFCAFTESLLECFCLVTQVQFYILYKRRVYANKRANQAKPTVTAAIHWNWILKWKSTEMMSYI